MIIVVSAPGFDTRVCIPNVDELKKNKVYNGSEKPSESKRFKKVVKGV